MARFERQSDLVRCNLLTPIVVVGAGGIGSFLVLTLAKMGFQDIAVYDNDFVEEHNLPNQFYREQDLGQPKVVALRDLVYQFTGTAITTAPRLWNADEMQDTACSVLVSAVDNMATRREMFECFKAGTGEVFLDGRMGGEQVEVYCVPRGTEHITRYEGRLWTDAEASPVRCTSKATMYNVLTIAALMASQVRLVLQGEATRPCVVVDNFNIAMHNL